MGRGLNHAAERNNQHSSRRQESSRFSCKKRSRDSKALGDYLNPRWTNPDEYVVGTYAKTFERPQRAKGLAEQIREFPSTIRFLRINAANLEVSLAMNSRSAVENISVLQWNYSSTGRLHFLNIMTKDVTDDYYQIALEFGQAFLVDYGDSVGGAVHFF